MRSCWICGCPATTREHKIQRTDLVRVHGRAKIFRSANLSYMRFDESIVPLQGSKSNYVKYQNVLCGNCNNARSQPYDFAYDQFVQYIDNASESLLRRRQIDFESIYGEEWRESQINLFKYFVKTFGCRIADSDKSVPEDLRNFLNDVYPNYPLAICFAVDEKEILKSEEEQTTLAICNLVHSTGKSAQNRYASAARYRWLLISYWYNWGPYGPMGEPWHRDQQFLCFGSYTDQEANKVHIRNEDGTLIEWCGIES